VCVQNSFLAYGALGTIRVPILHRNKHYLQRDRSEILYDTRHLGVLLGASKYISKHMVHSMQFVYLSCIKISTTSKQNQTELPLEPLYPGVSSGASKMVS